VVVQFGCEGIEMILATGTTQQNSPFDTSLFVICEKRDQSPHFEMYVLQSSVLLQHYAQSKLSVGVL